MKYLKLLGNLINNNRVKSIFLVIAMVAYYFAGSISDDTIVRNLLGSVTYGNKTFYVVEHSEHVDILESNKSQVIKNSTITYNEYSAGNVLLWVCFVIAMIVVLIATFSNEDDMNWEFNHSWR